MNDYDKDIISLIEAYKDHIQNFINSDIYKLMLESDHCYKEKEFSFKNENNQIIHGIFDALCIKDNKITIIDYKTDRISKNTSIDILKDLHKEQLFYYKTLLSHVFNNYPIDCVVYYLHIDKFVIF